MDRGKGTGVTEDFSRHLIGEKFADSRDVTKMGKFMICFDHNQRFGGERREIKNQTIRTP